MYVKSLSNTVRAPGQMVTIFGGFFDYSCKVYFGNSEGTVFDYDDEKIVAVVPADIGNFVVKVKKGIKEIIAGTLYVKELKDTDLLLPKNYSHGDFFEYVKGMFPRGRCFDLRKQSNFGKLITSLSVLVLYIWDLIINYIVELSSSHTNSFDEWEDDLGLPIDGINADGESDRRSEIYRVDSLQAGDTVPYFQKILDLCGITADIYEYWKNPEMFEGYDFEPSDDKNFFWKIQIHYVSFDFVKRFVSGSVAGSHLMDWVNTKVETIFDFIKPAHTRVIYGYDDALGTTDLMLNGERLSLNGELLTLN